MADTQGSVQNAYFAPSRLASPTQPPTCPNCGSARAWKDGLRKTESGSIQRWLCRDCGFRFSSSSELKNKKENQQTLKRRVCVADGAMKNLAEVENPKEVGKREATYVTDDGTLSFNFAWWMKKQGYAEQTIECRTKLLKTMIRRGADLNDPESVKDVIARQNWSSERKETAVHTYTLWLRMTGGKWEPPRFKRVERLPWIPTEKEIDELIAGCSHRIATFLQLLKETGMRPGEAWQLKWTYIDFERGAVYVTPEKGSKPRFLKISSALASMLKSLRRRNEFVFQNGKLHHFEDGFRMQRKRIAYKLSNPRINLITFKTLRHFKATMEYHRTKDILHVMQLLGHRSIKNTLVYTHLVNFESDEYVSKIAKTGEEACKLI
ncbi:MAG: site-specific integrase, partial [Candidatus Bathyarchaeia archaeon]